MTKLWAFYTILISRAKETNLGPTLGSNAWIITNPIKEIINITNNHFFLLVSSYMVGACFGMLMQIF